MKDLATLLVASNVSSFKEMLFKSKISSGFPQELHSNLCLFLSSLEEKGIILIKCEPSQVSLRYLLKFQLANMAKMPNSTYSSPFPQMLG